MVSLYSVVLLSLLLVLVRIYAFTKLQSVFHCRWNTQTNKYLKNNQKSIFKSALQAKRDFSPPTPTYNDDNTIEKSSNNGLVYTVDLPRRAGIEWGSDLSFRWIYVRGLEEGGEAERSGVIQKGE